MSFPPESSAPGRARIVVLASGAGSLFSAIAAAADGEGFPATVVALGTDKACAALEKASAAGLETFTVRLRDFADRALWDEALTAATAGHRPDLVVTAGFMKVLGPAFLARFGGQIINSHPALLPAFPGAHAVPQALAHGVKITGTTVHLVDAGVDTGPILAQEAVAVFPGDDEATLHERIKTVERRLLVHTIAAVASRGITIDGRKASIL